MFNDFNLDRSILNFAVFGNPVKHSKSPRIHSLFANQTALDINYQAIEVPVDKFDKYVNSFSLQGGKGLNITVPFKEQAAQLCDQLSDRAALCGSVNTIRFDEQKNIVGDTTDGQGLINDLLNNHRIKIRNKKVLVLGAGGSVKAILEPLCRQQPAKIIIANRTVSRARELANKFNDDANVSARAYSELQGVSFDLIINGTSLSLKGEVPTVPKTVINNNTCCYDLMYSDHATVFMQWAKRHGAAKALDGLGMLVEQAAESFLIWHGVKPDTSEVIKVLRK